MARMSYLAFTLLFGHLCFLQGALLKREDMQAVRSQKHEDSEALTRRIEKREGDVSIEVFDAHVTQFEDQVAALSNMMDMISTELLGLTQDLSTYIDSSTQAINSNSAKIATLEDNYNTRTIKNCISGFIGNSVAGKHSFTFNPPFSSTPTLLYAVTALDADNKAVRFDVGVDSLTASGCTLDIRSWAGSRVAWAETRYLACR